MIKVNWIIFEVLPIIGFFLAVTLLVHQNQPRRSPASTIAWLLAILLVPYFGVPAYILFGGRKLKRMTKNKADLALDIKACGERLITPGVGCIFPLRPGNEVSLLVNGEKAYSALVELIEHAEKSIDITTYILGNDETGTAILAALTRRAKQGIAVRLLLDALGSFTISKKMLAPLVAAGGRCAFFIPMMHLLFRGRANLRNHRKIIIVDNTVAMLGGMNIAREYMGATAGGRRWYDLSLIVKGPVLADLQHVFSSDWRFAAKQDTPPGNAPGHGGSGADVALQAVPSGPDVAGDPLYESIITVFFKARRRVWIVTPYFIPDEMLLKSICIAAKRGIDVRIVIPRVSNHPLADLVRRNYLRQVQESGATIYNFTPGMMHGKLILVDNELGIVGSMNTDLRSFFLNYEIALFIYNEDTVNELDRWVTDLISQSVPGIKKANVLVEFFEGIARLLAPLL
ncbi:MAG: cardiolipin synthase [Chitinivibrionales bacterium]|nr:cardiolipin synthase [Chitinivibrionales bacterium]